MFDALEVSPGQSACLEVTVDDWGVGPSSILDDWVAVLRECGVNPGDIVATDTTAESPEADTGSESTDEFLGDGSPAIATEDNSPPLSPSSDGYARVTDETSFLTVVVPESWNINDIAPSSNDDGSPQPWIFASSVDPDEFDATFASGVLYIAIPYQADPEAVITSSGLTSGCETIEVQSYTDPIFTGAVQVGTECGPDGGSWNMVVASPADHSFTAIVQLQIATPADQAAFDMVLATFTYAGDPRVPPEMMVPSVVPLPPPLPTQTPTGQVPAPIPQAEPQPAEQPQPVTAVDQYCEVESTGPFSEIERCYILYSDGSTELISEEQRQK